MSQSIDKMEDEGIKNLLKHFDRIHDKLFTFNNILIAGYFTLSKLEKDISLFSLLIPIANLIFLMFIEYKMLNKSKFESQITLKPQHEIDKWAKDVKRINSFSASSIISTLIVTIVFLIYLLL